MTTRSEIERDDTLQAPRGCNTMQQNVVRWHLTVGTCTTGTCCLPLHLPAPRQQDKAALTRRIRELEQSGSLVVWHLVVCYTPPSLVVCHMPPWFLLCRMSPTVLQYCSCVSHVTFARCVSYCFCVSQVTFSRCVSHVAYCSSVLFLCVTVVSSVCHVRVTCRRHFLHTTTVLVCHVSPPPSVGRLGRKCELYHVGYTNTGDYAISSRC